MITVAAAKERARAILNTKAATWATDPDAADEARVVLALHPPTERDALSSRDATERWAMQWSALPQHPGMTIDWVERSWRALGRQVIPTRLSLAGAGSIATFVGGASAVRYTTLRDRSDFIRRSLGVTDSSLAGALRRSANAIGELPQSEVDRLIHVVGWLRAHDVRGLRPRQIPVRGVDTKWIGAHRGMVTELVTAFTGRPDLGLETADPLVRVRILDADLGGRGPRSFAASGAELSALEIEPAAVVIVENLETLLALPSIPGVVALHGSGFAVDVAGGVPWVRSRSVVYWGDLDSNGFAILHRLRTSHENVVSVLMDTVTLLDHHDLWVEEPRPARGTYPALTMAESETMTRLREEGGVRLEQERIPLEYALPKLERAVVDHSGALSGVRLNGSDA